jgi:hypothetical protein
MRIFLRERADELEQLLNWVNDQDGQWWPFVFLRPDPTKRMGSLRVAALSTLFGVFFGVLANVVLVATTNASTARPNGLVFPMFTTLGFFVVYRATFAYSWNRRAARLAAESTR